ncbi:hypothetical protein MUP77_21865 [Candidatus Bathyarchaeota archaeon]|nr:hypothetical protein [Candidatus Bathyarchaeota archaeon]
MFWIIHLKRYLLISFMCKCEICYDWCSRIEITRQWWDIAKNDWNSLNGKDLPYYIAILAVLRGTTTEIFCDEDTSKNHSTMETDKNGYALASNKNCGFIPLEESQKKTWHGLFLTIRAFRNGAAHISYIKAMNPSFLAHRQLMNPEDASQDYYRYAPFPDLRKYSSDDLKEIHEFIRHTILSDVRSLESNIDSGRITYEFIHVDRGPFIDLLHAKMIDLLKEVKVW